MKNNILISFWGDLYIKQSLPNIRSKSVLNILNSCDYSVVNLEGPITDDSDDPSIKLGTNLCQSDEVLKFMKANRFNVVGLANNHIMDYGLNGLVDTFNKLKGFLYSGAGLDFKSAIQPVLINDGGVNVKMMFVAENEFGYTDGNASGFAWINHPLINKKVIKNKINTDLLVVICHAGIEKIDVPIPIWRDRYRELIDFGADMVIGHHPHVAQGYEIYKNKYIFYSLGNFFIDTTIRSIGDNGIGVVIEISKKGYKVNKILPISNIDDNVVSDHSVDIDLLNKKISPDKYSMWLNKYIDQIWINRYKKFNKMKVTGLSKIFKNIINFIFDRKIDYGQWNSLVDFHNNIESHHYIFKSKQNDHKK